MVKGISYLYSIRLHPYPLVIPSYTPLIMVRSDGKFRLETKHHYIQCAQNFGKSRYIDEYPLKMILDELRFEIDKHLPSMSSLANGRSIIRLFLILNIRV